MRTWGLSMFFMGVLLWCLTSCGSGGARPPRSVGDVANGEKLYNQPMANAPGCYSCHSLDKGVTMVGPSHFGVGRRAETAVPGQSAEDYLRESIINPNAHLTEGFAAGVMYQNYGADLSEKEVDDLVAYLMTLK